MSTILDIKEISATKMPKTSFWKKKLRSVIFITNEYFKTVAFSDKRKTLITLTLCYAKFPIFNRDIQTEILSILII